ncbi:hypothetical protein STEG23_016111, partial [Scotinomys teguina]
TRADLQLALGLSPILLNGILQAADAIAHWNWNTSEDKWLCSLTIAMCTLERLRTQELITYKDGCLHSLNLILKAWKASGELVVISSHWEEERRIMLCQWRMASEDE